jgi:hypothetical protein
MKGNYYSKVFVDCIWLTAAISSLEKLVELIIDEDEKLLFSKTFSKKVIISKL